jgi:hypothetical protein
MLHIPHSGSMTTTVISCTHIHKHAEKTNGVQSGQKEDSLMLCWLRVGSCVATLLAALPGCITDRGKPQHGENRVI